MTPTELVFNLKHKGKGELVRLCAKLVEQNEEMARAYESLATRANGTIAQIQRIASERTRWWARAKQLERIVEQCMVKDGVK